MSTRYYRYAAWLTYRKNAPPVSINLLHDSWRRLVRSDSPLSREQIVVLQNLLNRGLGLSVNLYPWFIDGQWNREASTCQRRQSVLLDGLG